jgi:hypothetical protein
MEVSVLDQVRAAAAKRILFFSHAVHQMSRPSRMISPAEIDAVIAAGELVEDYRKMCEATAASSSEPGTAAVRSTSSARPSRITWPSLLPISLIPISGLPSPRSTARPRRRGLRLLPSVARRSGLETRSDRVTPAAKSSLVWLRAGG